LADTFDSFLSALLPNGASADLAARLRPVGRELRLSSSHSADLLHDAAHYIWIAHGNAKLVARGANGRQQVIEFHFADDLMLMPERGSHNYSLVAISPCELVVLPAFELQEVARDNPDLAIILLQRMTSALAISRENSLILGRKRAIERVAGFLLSIRARVTMSDISSSSVLLPMSRRDIGDHLAITVESISREVGRLRSEQLIETPGRAKACILDPDGLADRAGFFAGAT
jgi:CRP/FNR family transcriptional regulator